MKKLITAILLSAIPCFSMAEIEEDKIKHFGYSTAIGFATNTVTQRWTTAFGICAAVGAFKEVYDEKDYGGASAEDFAYDLAGCALGVGLSEVTGLKIAIIPNRGLDGASMAINFDF
ncbi:hypothetical protein P7F88_16465 [Vibrio hannami]|uniref:hypothetical protein n=1 Tax=Vibrio hannami TaxID=2717094 RepID=UPI00240E9DE1|nr:hypothetical protein [Vibrio hannami]MDG3087569.1 hypothetical protein [Vibrio hannami]